VLIAALGLASCSGVRTINYGQPYQPTAARSFLAWAGSAGPVPLEIAGNPFPQPDREVAAAIAEAASGFVPGMSTRFTAEAGEAAHPDWRVVYAFNVAAASSSASICEHRQPVPSVVAKDTLTALVVFCNEAKPIISAGVWSPPVKGPGTPEFQSLARYAIVDLFPPEFSGADRDPVDYPEP
jgi:hypothetical protein